jgi:hypothetical protein
VDSVRCFYGLYFVAWIISFCVYQVYYVVCSVFVKKWEYCRLVLSFCLFASTLMSSGSGAAVYSWGIFCCHILQLYTVNYSTVV